MSRSPNRKPSREILWTLSDNMKQRRLVNGFTQKDLARICGFHKNYVSNVEQATVNISLANLEALALGLRCSEEDLLRRVVVVEGSDSGQRAITR